MTVNYLAVVLGAVLNIAFARVWYGLIFNSLWRNLTGRTPEEKPAIFHMAVAGVFALMMSFGVQIMVAILNINTYSSAIIAGLILGIFFIKPIVLGEWIWDKKPYALVALNASFYVLYFMFTFILSVYLK